MERLPETSRVVIVDAKRSDVEAAGEESSAYRAASRRPDALSIGRCGSLKLNQFNTPDAAR